MWKVWMLICLNVCLLHGVVLADDITFEENFIVVGIRITNVDIENGITVVIEPPDLSGILQITAQYNGGSSYEIINETITGGTHLIPFDIENLPEGEYSVITATWTTDSPIQSTYNYHFIVLGTYLHTQYNTPIESDCGGSPSDACLSDTQCQYANITLLSDFISEVYENGSGSAINYGSVQWGEYCWINGYPLTPPCYYSNTFAQVSSIIGSCGSAVQAGQTVAVHPSHPNLDCGDKIYIHTIGKKTVTDYCPACRDNDYHHIDNYGGASGCNEAQTLGSFITIKLFD